MQKIKTIQPYKLYAKLVNAKPSVKTNIKIYAIIFAVLSLFWTIDEPIMYPIFIAFFLILISPLTAYNPWLKRYYQPKKSFDTVRAIAQGGISPIITKHLPIIGIIGGVLVDVIFDIFPGGILILGGGFNLIALIARKKPEVFMDKEDKIQQKFHRNIDYNAKLNLNTTFGINDKLILSYQNFPIKQKKLEKGNYILGISPLGIYFIHKKNSVEKLFIRYEEIEALGVCMMPIGKVSILTIRSIYNNELNIITDRDESYVVSPMKLYGKLLTSIDEFLLNGSVETSSVSHRRRVVTSTSQIVSKIPQSNERITGGRVIDINDTSNLTQKSVEKTTGRVIDIEYTPEVTAELAQGSFIEANRAIDVY